MSSVQDKSPFGPIPADWRSTTFESEADVLTGFPFPSSAFGTVGVRLVRGSNVKRGVFDWSEAITEYWPHPSAAIKLYEMRVGDLVVAMDGALVGRSFATIKTSDLPALLVQRVARLRSKRVDQRLLAAWIASESFVRHVDLVKTQTAIPHISPKDIRTFRLAVPVAEVEQIAIADAVEGVSGLVAGLERLIAKKRDIKQAAMQQLLTGRTRLPGYSGEWLVLQARELGWIRGGSGFPVAEQGERTGDYPYFKVSDMNSLGNEEFLHTSGSWITESTRKRIGATAYPAGAIVFAKVGAAVFLERKRILSVASCIDNNLAVFVLNEQLADVRFVHQVLQLRRLGDLVSTTALPALNARDIGSLGIDLPPLDEQRAIARAIIDMQSELTALESRLTKTRALKQAMMQELLSGRTRLA